MASGNHLANDDDTPDGIGTPRHVLTPLAAVAFDLDGTLIDSAPDIAHALNTALGREGYAGFGLEQVIRWVGDGPDALIDRALDFHRAGSDDPGLVQRLRRTYREVALAEPLGRGAPFPGIPEVLAAFSLRWPLVVVTNKPPDLAEGVLQVAGLRQFFRQVHGPLQREERKPAPFLLESAAAALEIGTDRLLLVGDSAADLGAAAAAGCPVVYAGWGYGKPGALAPYPHTPHLNCPEELLTLLDG